MIGGMNTITIDPIVHLDTRRLLLLQPSIPRFPCQIIWIELESNSRWYIYWGSGQATALFPRLFQQLTQTHLFQGTQHDVRLAQIQLGSEGVGNGNDEHLGPFSSQDAVG